MRTLYILLVFVMIIGVIVSGCASVTDSAQYEKSPDASAQPKSGADGKGASAGDIPPPPPLPD